MQQWFEFAKKLHNQRSLLIVCRQKKYQNPICTKSILSSSVTTNSFIVVIKFTHKHCTVINSFVMFIHSSVSFVRLETTVESAQREREENRWNTMETENEKFIHTSFNYHYQLLYTCTIILRKNKKHYLETHDNNVKFVSSLTMFLRFFHFLIKKYIPNFRYINIFCIYVLYIICM